MTIDQFIANTNKKAGRKSSKTTAQKDRRTYPQYLGRTSISSFPFALSAIQEYTSGSKPSLKIDSASVRQLALVVAQMLDKLRSAVGTVPS
jgi:hypothetical protein